MPARATPLKRQRGVSLIELTIAIVIITIAATLSLSALVPAAQSVQVNEEVQLATQAAQACAEHILNIRSVQTNGWNNVPAGGNTLCNNIPVPSGYTRSLAIVALADATNPCVSAYVPNNLSCREVTITAGKTGGVVPAATFKFTIVNY